MPMLQTIMSWSDSRSQTLPPVQPYLTSVEEVSLDNSDPEMDITADVLDCFLFFPRLRSLSLNSFWESKANFDITGPPSSLETLRIEGCDRRTDDLHYVLQRCNNLRTLSIEYLSSDDAHRSFGWPGLGNALRRFCPRLESLRLDSWPKWSTELTEETLEAVENDFHMPDDYMESAELGGLGNLKSLTALTSLTITENALRGTLEPESLFDHDGEPIPLLGFSELLPTSLKHLTVICEKEYIRDKRRLLQDPFVSGLEECVIANSKKSHWYSKTGGEGGVDPVERN